LIQNRGRDMSAPNSIVQKSNPASLGHKNELVRPTVARDEIQRIRLCMQRELELAKKFRIEAEKYQQEMGTRARSQACMLLLRARMATQKEIIAEFKRKANQEIQKEIEQLQRKAIKEIIELISAANQEIQKEIEQLKCKVNEEMNETQQILTDIRTIRIAAYNELQIQRRLADATSIIALGPSSQEEDGQTLEQRKEMIRV
jgi:F0F1-type ATP synthase membrane subunit b/b'